MAAGNAARVSVNGLVRSGGWNWTPGAPVFAGKNGELTQTPPVTGFVQQIGIATGADALLVRLGIPIRRA